MRELGVPEIESALRALADELDVADVDLAPRVIAAVAGRPRRGTLLRPAFVVAAVLAVAVVLVTAVEPARQAVADWLGIGSTRIEVVDSSPDLAGLAPLVSALGEGTTAIAAERALGAPPKLPASLGEPAAWFAGEGGVSAVWRSGEGLPDVAGTGLGLVLTQRLVTDEDAIGAFKQVGPGIAVLPTEVDGDYAVFIEGPHIREQIAGRPAVAANVLLWVTAGVEFRLESNLELAGAIAVAETLR